MGLAHSSHIDGDAEFAEMLSDGVGTLLLDFRLLIYFLMLSYVTVAFIEHPLVVM